MSEPSAVTSATEGVGSSTQRGKLTKRRPVFETATPVTCFGVLTAIAAAGAAAAAGVVEAAGAAVVAAPPDVSGAGALGGEAAGGGSAAGACGCGSEPHAATKTSWAAREAKSQELERFRLRMARNVAQRPRPENLEDWL